MLTAPKESTVDPLELVLRLVRQRLPADQAAQVELFVRRFYESVPPEDLLGRAIDDLYGAALAQWRFIQRRAPGEAKIHLYNPTVEADGWQSPHTAIAVVNDDMPFIIDSMAAYLVEQGLTVHVLVHPILRVRRDAEGRLESLSEDGAGEGAGYESCALIEIDQRTSADALAAIEAGLSRVLADVRATVESWRLMLSRLAETIAFFEKSPPRGVPSDEVGEAVSFLKWMTENHFTFLGYREYVLDVAPDGAMKYRVIPNSGLGLLHDPAVRPLGAGRGPEGLPPEVRNFFASPNLLMITKAAILSTVHRPVPMDSIGIKVFDEDGKVIGEHRFVGLFTSTAYSHSVFDIPVVRRKVRDVLEQSKFRAGGHDYKALEHILETLPRDELFQIGSKELLDLGVGILHVEKRQRTGLFVRHDPFERFVACLVFLPRERYNTDLRKRVQWILEGAFGGVRSRFQTQVADSPLARLHFIVETTPGEIPDYDLAEIEARIVDATRSWGDHLREALCQSFGEERGTTLERRYSGAFPAAYREDFTANIAVKDVEKLDEVRRTRGLAMTLYRRPEQPAGHFNLKIYHAEAPIPLSDLLPRLENMGLRVLSERPYRVRPGGSAAGGVPMDGVQEREAIWIHDLSMVDRAGIEIDIAEIRDCFQEAFERIWVGEAEDDGFNQLVVRLGLRWREVAVLRAISKYLRQVGIPFSQAYMEETLANNGPIAAKLVRLFLARFDPSGASERSAVPLRTEIVEALDAVQSLDQDRILRRYLNVIDSTQRTNYFQTGVDGAPKAHLAFKLDSRALDELPLPRPLVEIFVYSPRVEGIHLRGGKVARGGIRWSDRREDFRTEILSLMKAQMVKNAVIVPVGAKGGFVVKRPPAEVDRDALRQEGIACYRIFVSGLLDLTDNREQDQVIAPPVVVRYDEDDPYLVVAADKGTATFSDIANGIASEYGFWLGDAFASGGQEGYDHKAMGITARGAWECVKRHFRELGRDIQAEDFTVVGVGDMAGDVFGNGMLQSRHIRLIGAFNHRHIFVDPDPDAEASFEERKRLFDLPGSSWTDYGRLSSGGAVFDRRAKSVTISPQVRARLGIERETLTPNELIRALLRAPVDLLWFGGIGCFVKASHERDADVGDRVNDAVRVTADELHGRVIGEGANLAVTQAGRIEFAQAGGHINTDAIDNSAGVDCSDHEVNIKILLNQVVADGDMTTKQRNALLHGMTEEVAELVLRDNYLQSQAISVEQARAPELLDAHAHLMRALERRGRLDRIVEFLPDDEVLAERSAAGQGLTRPEIAVLLAYAKTTLFADLLESDVPEDSYLAEDLVRYFPEPLQIRFAETITRHRLSREIIATSIANSVVNRAGSTFVSEVVEDLGVPVGEIARAYTAARHVFQLRRIWQAIETLDNQVASKVQLDMTIDVARLMEHQTLWVLHNRTYPIDISEVIEAYEDGAALLSERVDAVLPPERLARFAQRRDGLADSGVPAELAADIAGIDAMMSACDIVDVAKNAQLPVDAVARTYFRLGAEFSIDWLREVATDLLEGNHWQHRAVAAVIYDLYGQQRALCQSVLASANGHTPEEAVDAWVAANEALVARTTALFDELKSGGPADLAMLTVANRQIRSLIIA